MMSDMIFCPRCNSSDTELMTQSKSADWQVYMCSVCFYSWRTSELEAFTRHDLYDPRFRLSPERIANFSDHPPIPARKSAAEAPARPGARRPIRRGGMDS